MTHSYSGQRTPDAQKRQREREIAENIKSLHLTSRLVQRLHVSHAAAVATTLARTLPEQFSFAQLEQAVAELVGDSEFLREMRPDSPEELALKAAEKKANPSKIDVARLSAEDRLAFANKKKLEELEASEAEARKREVTDNKFDASTPTTAAQRLGIANAWRGVGIDLDEKKNPGPTREELRKDVNRRLSVANEQAAAAAKKAKA